MRQRFIITLLCALLAGSAGAATIDVPGSYSTIQAAINAALAGDTIVVGAGTYPEQLLVNKALTLQGGGVAVLNGSTLGGSTTAVRIKSGNVTFDGFEVKNYTVDGIIVGYEASTPGNLQNVHVTNNRIHDILPGAWGFGIYAGYEAEGFDNGKLTAHLDYSGLVISGNEIWATGNAGIVVQSVTAGTGTLQVINNYMHDIDNDGLWIDSARMIDVVGNTMTNNYDGVLLTHLSNWYELNGPHAPKDISITGCTITNSETRGIGLYAGWPSTISVSNCLIDGNLTYGIYNPVADMLDAEDNYWGDPTGPTHASNPGGLGDVVGNNVDFTPWRTGTLVCSPDPLVLSNAAPSGAIEFDYLGGGSSPVYGYSVEVLWDPAIATAGAFTRPASGAFASAALFQVVNLGAGRVRVDAALGGSVSGIAFGPLFATSFTAAGGEGTQTVVDLTIRSLRNNLNQPVTGVAADDGLIFVDTVNPVVAAVAIANTTLVHTDDYVKNTDAITVTATITEGDPAFGGANLTADLTALGGGAAVHPDTYVAPVATWNLAAAACAPVDGTLTVPVTAIDNAGNTGGGSDTIIADNTAPTPLLGVTAQPGHQKIHLGWTDATGNDLHPYGVEFRYAAWGDYPAYDTSAPAYPAAPGAGLLACQATSGITADWAIVPRDIHYLAGFVYDMALNYSAAGTANTARATNYWLGDVASPYNGLVNIMDFSKLGDTYGLAEAEGGFDPECNVGPTDTGSPRAIPLPNDDHEVGFEDLMIFAMNFGTVSPALKAMVLESPVLAWQLVEGNTWALVLERECGGLKGLNLSANLPAGVTCLVTAGALLDEQSSPTFVRNIARHGLDAGLAVMGRGVGLSGRGELIRVTFSAAVTVAPEIVARGVENEDLSVNLAGIDDRQVPAVADVTQNYPNPFNPRTTIAFSVPATEHVLLAVYGIDGAHLRTLVDEVRTAGRYTAEWDGLDQAGRPVASGSYLYVVRIGEFSQVRKMSLMR